MKPLSISVLLAVVAFASGYADSPKRFTGWAASLGRRQDASGAENPLAQVAYAPRPDKLPEAAREHLAGSGLFVINVDMATGKVKSVQIEKSTGHALLDRSAIQTFQKFRFRPGTVRRVVAPISFTARSHVGQY